MRSERAGSNGDEHGSGPAKPGPDRALPQLLTVSEVAEILRVSLKTVQRLRLPCVRFGRSVRYSQQALSKWLEARQED